MEKKGVHFRAVAAIESKERAGISCRDVEVAVGVVLRVAVKHTQFIRGDLCHETVSTRRDGERPNTRALTLTWICAMTRSARQRER